MLAESDHFLALSFRGTKELKDVATDLDPTHSSFGRVRLHKGFLTRAEQAVSGRARIADMLFARMQADATRRKTLLLTGHSLGGSAAICFAIRRLVLAAPNGRLPEFLARTKVVTFAAPLCVNRESHPKLNRVLQRGGFPLGLNQIFVNYVNKSDPVPNSTRQARYLLGRDRLGRCSLGVLLWSACVIAMCSS